jgi:hypothetical protein
MFSRIFWIIVIILLIVYVAPPVAGFIAGLLGFAAGLILTALQIIFWVIIVIIAYNYAKQKGWL